MATITVNSLNDNLTVDTQITLREALQAANTDTSVDGSTAGSGADTIIFDPSLAGQTITLASELVISSDVTITGLGADQLTISGNNATRIFNVNDGNNSNYANVTIEGLTLTAGSTTGNGGAIYSIENLTVTNSTISGNSAGGDGGGIYNYATLAVSNSTISGNSANNRGGGIYNYATLTVTNSTISGNSANLFFGGGIRNSFGTTEVSNSTISGNSATNGGGIHNDYGGTLTVTNSTISGNSATNGGGIRHSSGTTEVSSTIIAGNTSNDVSGNNAFTSGGNNLIGNGDTATGFTNGVNGDIVGTTASPINPGLDPLANNGGTTQTHALQDNSPAIDAGSNPNNLTTDQRGNTRVTGNSADIGAYESPGPIIVTSIEDNTTVDGQITLREALQAANNDSTVDGVAGSGADTIIFDPSLAGQTITLSSQLTISADVIITGLGADQLTISGNNATRIFNVNDGNNSNQANVTIEGLTLTAGNVTSGDGGAIFTRENLTVSNSTISGNSARRGGGLYNISGALTVTNSTISGNSTTLYGGGIRNSSGTTEVNNSTISGNSATRYGGGIQNASGTTEVTNSTISGNSAGNGGGIRNSSGTVEVSSTIIAGNTSNDVSGNNAFTSGGNNLIGNGDTATGFTNGVNGDIVGTAAAPIDPRLDPLADNRGTTQTHALQGDSPAIDAGSNPNNLTTDQRGEARVSGTSADIGAYESSGPIIVTSIEDNTTADGQVTLREAIEAANNDTTVDGVAGSGADTIIFDASLAGQTITLASELVISADVIITGLGADQLTISGNNATRIFNVNDGNNSNYANVTIEGLTLTAGSTTGNGGAIYSIENLTVTNSTISGNSAGGDGGGIYNYATLAVSNSTISGNSANSRGGGIYNYATLTVNNSTISGNSANSRGGGIYHYYEGRLTVRNSTITGNSANSGGGIYNDDGITSVASTIIAGNSSNNDISGTFNSSGNNLIGNGDGGAGFTNGTNGDIVGTAAAPIDPGLDPLANNGGTTQTHALQSNSPAIDAGSNPNNLTTDQRGEVRVSGVSADIGAYELPATIIVTSIEDNTTVDGQVTLREALQAANNDTTVDGVTGFGADTIIFDPSLAGQTITLASELVISSDVIITGLGADQLTISGNNATRIFNVNDGNNTADKNVTIEELTLTAGNTTNTGGAILNIENLTVNNSTISGNSANRGGAIYNSISLTVTNSTISGNSANSGGGGIYNSFGTANVTNSTISGNSANSGGGIYNYFGTANVTNSTISGNSANSGGGIRHSSGTIEVSSTIIAGNTSNDVSGNNAFTSGGNNLIGNGDTATGFTNGVNGDIVGTTAAPIDPGLNPLADNGGTTLTHALQSNSVAIDTGSNPNNLTTDQRGEVRVSRVSADIGAYEFEFIPPTVSITSPTPNAIEGGSNGVFTISRDDSIGDLTVNLTINGSSTAVADDYNLSGGSVAVAGSNLTVTIPDGSTSVDVNLSAVADIVAEPAETLQLDIATDANYAIDGVNNSATVTIDASLAPQLVINEIDYDQVGADGDNFIELFNNDTDTINLNGYQILLVNQDGTTYDTITLDNVDLAAGDYYVISNNATNIANTDQEVTFTLQNGIDAVALVFGSNIIDTVSYEGDTTTYTEGTGTTVADLNDFADVGLSRFPNGTDTNDNSADFVLQGITPGTVNSVTPTVTLSIDSNPATLNDGGSTATITATIDTYSGKDVTVNLAFSGTATEGTDYTVPNSITIPAGQLSADITLTTVDDSIVEGDEAIVVDIASVANGVEFGTEQVNATITDDENSGITVTPTSGLTTTEAGGTAEFTIVLDSQPSSLVFINVASSDTTEGTITSPSILFDSNNWNVPQTVTVTGVDDFIDDDDVIYTVSTAAVTNDPNYQNQSGSTVTIINQDDGDLAGVTINKNTLTTSEDLTTDEFTVVLDSQPVADVVVNFTGDSNEGSFVSGVTFTDANWDTPQTVTVTGVDDFVADGDISYTLTTTVTSTDAKYDVIATQDLTVTNTDNDIANVTVSPISNNTSETGDTGTFTIVLDTQPSDDVVVTLASSDTDEGTVDQNALTFTANNWDVPQTVTVAGVDDFVVDGDIPYTITTTVTSTNDTDYNNIATDDVAVTNIDDDAIGVTVTPTSVTTSEAGSTAEFTLQLDTQPTGDVAIALNNSDLTEGTIDQSTLNFTSANWNTPQTVTVTGVDDTVDDGDVQYEIVTSIASSADADYAILTASDINNITVTNTNDDEAGVTFTPISIITDEVDDPSTVAVREDQASFTVVLDIEPIANVTVTLINNEDEGSLDQSSVIFTPTNWDTPQTVTFTAADDFVNDGDITFNIGASVSSGDNAYNFAIPDAVSVTNRDNDIAGVNVSTISNNTSEEVTTGEFTVVLDTQPSADVIVGFSGDANEGDVASGITFTSTNWDVPQTVTVTGVDDDVVDGDVAYTIDTTVISNDPAYDGFQANSVAVTNLDNDTASVIVTPDGNNTSEDGDTSTFSVQLSSQPTADVIISFASDNPAEGTVNNPNVTFTSANWDTPQDVTVTGVDDALADGDINYNVVGTINTTDANYSSLAPVSVNLNNNDNETADFTISPLSNNTAEDGTSGTFTIVMDAQPSDTVTLNITSSDTTEATVDISTVNFTPNTWDTPQTVTVTGVDDLVDDGDTAFEIQFSPAVSNDNAFDGIQPDALTSTNLDDDEAGFAISPVSNDTSETGNTATFTLNLTSQPTDDVIIGITSDNPNEGTADVSALTFTSGNWDTPQTVTVTGVDDELADGDISYNILTSADTTTSDTNYLNLDPVDVIVINNDDETPGINFSGVSGNTTEAGDNATFTVSLDSQPSSDVILNLVSDDTSEGIVDNSPLTFTSANWNTVQTVTVTGVDDLIDDGDVAFDITATATSNDIAYNNLNPATVTIVNEDDDTAGITVSDISNNTSEAGEAGTFTVILDTQPTADVVVNLVSDNTAEGTVDSNALTFTSDNWNTSQTVTVTGVDDNVVDGDINYSITATVSSNDTNYNGIATNPVNIINADNDDPGITFSPVSSNTTEGGGSATFSAVLDTQPSADVVLNLASDDTTEGTVDNNTLIFTTSNWDTPQTVTVTGIDDNLEDGNITYNIVTNITSNDSNYDNQDVVDITLINEDNDGAGILITQSDGSTQVSEDGATDTYTVALNTIPTTDVNLTFTPNNAEIDLGTGAGNPLTLNFAADATALTPQTVTVAAIDDQEEEDNQTSIIVTSAASNDPDYNGTNPQVFLDGVQNNQITVAIADNDLVDDNDSTTVSLTHPNDNNIFAIGGNSTDALTLEFSLQTDTDAAFVNEVGVFVVDDVNGGIDTDGDGTIDLNPGDEGYAEAALASGQVIFTALPGGLGNNQVSSTIRSFSGDSFLSFYLVQDSSTDTYIQNSADGTTPPSVFFSSVLSNGDGINHLDVTTQGENDFVIGFEDVFNGGDNDFNDVQLTVQTTTETATVGTGLQASNRLEVFDLRSYAGQFVRGEIEVLPSSNAGFDNLVGIYVVIDDIGTVVDPTTGNRLSPGDTGYAAAARANSIVEFDSNGTDPILFSGGFTYATYLVADGGNGGENTYFPFLDANIDGLDHSRLLGDNIFSFEDINGGGDLSYDDFVFRTEFTVI